MLYPQENETREVKDLSGIWSFRADRGGQGRKEEWFRAPLVKSIPMPVPASFNDLTQDISLRDHIGDVWYERSFFIPTAWRHTTPTLRFASAEHTAIVWLNGVEVAQHRGGFLPFVADISKVARFGAENRLTVMVNNELSWDILPPGFIKTYDDSNHPAGYKAQEIQFDFFNYSGINRPVLLLSLPTTRIEDILIRTMRQGADAHVAYSIRANTTDSNLRIRVRILDAEGNPVAENQALEGEIPLPNATLWEPGAAYLYTLEATMSDSQGALIDIYREPFGVRSLEVTPTHFLINGRPFYFQGCCKHEDMDIKGRGFDQATMIKDFNLMEWIGANSFRTSHYPYAEEVLRFADRVGMVVIDEAPAVGMRSENPAEPTYSEQRISSRTLAHHLQVMQELVARDKNHPSVVMWCVANEPIVNEPAAGDYFRHVIEETRRLDPSRPITLVTGDVVLPPDCHPFQYIDVMCINRYHSWYSDPGHLELIEMQVINELSPWHEHFKKPLILSEYGADTIAGFHADPPVMFSEEYQCALLANFHKGFDQLEFLIGEHVWNFADFATKQGVTRAIGNKKGVFTRQRQPKAAAHLLRQRWLLKRPLGKEPS